MRKIKQILLKIFFPHIALIIILIPMSAAILIYSFVFSDVNPSVKYLSYFLSAYSLIVVCVRIPAIFRKTKEIKYQNKYISRYFSDAALRVKISLYGSFAINVLYAAMQLGLGLINHSVWFYALSVYYFLLALMRFFLLKETRKEKLGENMRREYSNYRLCGIILLLMNTSLSVIIFYIVGQNRGFSYHYIMTIAIAAYTFFTFTVAIVNLVRYRKYNSPVISASKVINLAAALVSMLSLETAMLAAFNTENNDDFRKFMTACTGTVVCVLIFTSALYMIVHSTKQLRQIKKESFYNE